MFQLKKHLCKSHGLLSLFSQHSRMLKTGRENALFFNYRALEAKVIAVERMQNFIFIYAQNTWIVL